MLLSQFCDNGAAQLPPLRVSAAGFEHGGRGAQVSVADGARTPQAKLPAL